MSQPKYSMTLLPEMRARWERAAKEEGLVLSVWIRRNCEERLLLEPALAEPESAAGGSEADTGSGSANDEPDVLERERERDLDAEAVELSAKLAAMLAGAEEEKEEPPSPTGHDQEAALPSEDSNGAEDPDQMTVYDMLVPDPEEM